MEDEFDNLINRLDFIQKVVPPDDIYEFTDLTLQMNYALATLLSSYSNIDHVCNEQPITRKILSNLMTFRLRMRHKDMRVIDLEKFDLSN